MNKKSKTVLAILIVIIICIAAFIIVNYKNQYEVSELGSNENGTVYKIIAGNPLSSDTVCLIIGVHQREHDIHEAINETVSGITSVGGANDLSKRYVIYYIKLNDDIKSKAETRPAGETIANQFIVPDVKSENPFIAIDIHEIDSDFEFSNFICCVSNNSKTNEYANQLSDDLDIHIYNFKEGTSPQLVTEPIASQNINTLLFETATVNSIENKREMAKQFIYAVDSLKP